VVPLREAREHLMVMFDDPLELADVTAAYDHIDDVIVFNSDHDAWIDMAQFLHDRRNYFSTQHPQHLVRHEIGHAMHYRAISSFREVRDPLWYSESLGIEEARIAHKVSGRALWNPKEFVAEVYAGLWAKVTYDNDVIALFHQFKGVDP
jgi:hypothetical protein